MRSMLYLSYRSMKNRLFSSILTLLTIALSVSLLIGVERVREGTLTSFENTLSDTDLIVGARSGSVQLLLYSVFHIGSATQNVSWLSFQKWSSHPEVAWTIPISLGDSHKGYRVVGTSLDFFNHYKYGRKQALSFHSGGAFSDDLFSVVLGADVAANLAYDIGSELVLAHGVSDVSFQDHADKPFRVVGILKKTGTPVDRSLYVSLDGISAMHVDWSSGAPPMPGEEVSVERVRQMDLTPNDITAFLVGLKSKIGIFHLQREVNAEPEEALSAILPGVSFRELWQSFSIAEAALLVVAGFVVLAGILGMLSALLSTLNERRREVAILRALGAGPKDVFALLLGEALLLGVGGCLVGIMLLYGALWLSQPLIETYFGLYIPIQGLGSFDFSLLAGVLALAVIAGCIPAFKAYRQSLADGLSIKL